MYNSRDIEKNLKAVNKSTEYITNSYEIILVDDGSTNNCYREALKFKHKKVKTLKNNTG